METVKLKNGALEARALVVTCMLSLVSLFKERPIHFYELVQICRKPDHIPFGPMGDDLVNAALLDKRPDGYVVHDSVRNVVLSAVTGDDLEMTLGNPIAKGDA